MPGHRTSFIRMAWHNAPVANNSGDKAGKKHYVDNGWPKDADGSHPDHAVSELATHISGALSPFGDTEFPLPTDDLPFVQSKTVVNR